MESEVVWGGEQDINRTLSVMFALTQLDTGHQTPVRVATGNPNVSSIVCGRGAV